jgi:hypothetical protein
MATAALKNDTVPVHEWNLLDGTSIGLGTVREFNYWKNVGKTLPDDAVLGSHIVDEPASEDTRRAALLGEGY